MKERPILFSAPMVRAILEGRKTVTRRVVKFNDAGRVARGGKQWHIDDPNVIEACPYGRPGDRLWVRETFASCADVDECGLPPESDRCLFYRADKEPRCVTPGHTGPEDRGRWRPSIHMPRWASRITIEVTGVRVERLQDISYEDALHEGIHKIGIPADECGPNRVGYSAWEGDTGPSLKVTPTEAFHELWESINGAGSWDANPYVWVIEFKRVTP